MIHKGRQADKEKYMELEPLSVKKKKKKDCP